MFYSRDEPTLTSPFTTSIDSMSADWILRGLQESRYGRIATQPCFEVAYFGPDWQPDHGVATLSSLAESAALLQMDPSTDQISSCQVPEMDKISFFDGTVTVEKSGPLYWGQRNGYPFLISDQPPCGIALSAIKNSGKEYNILGWCSEVRGVSNQFAISVLPLFFQNHRKCPVCPNINRIRRVISEYWPRHQAEATPEFQRFVSALVSQFYNTQIQVSVGSGIYETTLRRAEIREHGLVLFCDNENHRNSDRDPIMEVEVRCDGFSLKASGISLSDGVHDLAKTQLSWPPTRPLMASHIVWRSTSDGQQDPIKFLTEGNRLTVVIDPSLGFPTRELEEAIYHLGNRLSHEREVRTPEETEQLLKDVRGRVTPGGQRTLEQGLWGATESINFIHSPTLRMAMIQALRKLDQPALVASRLVRDAICLHYIFINRPKALNREDFEELTREREQNEGDLILFVQDSWSAVIDAAIPCEGQSFRSFMLHVLALLQYFPTMLPGAREETVVEYYSLQVLDHGVRLNFSASQRTFGWSDLEAAFRSGDPKRLLGLRFDNLPDILARIPFQGLCENYFSPPQERCYSGRILSEVDLHMLCKEFSNLPMVPSPPASNYVLIRPARRYGVDCNWVHQKHSYPFSLYTCFRGRGQSIRSIKIAEYYFGHQWYFFMAVMIDEKYGTTPCQDPRILQLSTVFPPLVGYSNSKQSLLSLLLRALDQLVQELDLILTRCDEHIPENLEDPLWGVCDFPRGYFTTERTLSNIVGSGTQLELELELVTGCCNFVRNHLQGDPRQLRPPLSELKQQAEAARRSCAHFGRVSTISAPSSGSAQTSAIEGVGPFPCSFGLTGTKVMLFNACKAVLNTEHDWRRHELIQHQQQPQWICPEAVCRKSFFHKSAHLEKHLRDDHDRTGDLTEEVRLWYVRRNHQQSFYCPYCDKVIHHSLTSEEAIEERSRHLLAHIRHEGSDPDMVWVGREYARTDPGMEMEIVPNEEE